MRSSAGHPHVSLVADSSFLRSFAFALMVVVALALQSGLMTDVTFLGVLPQLGLMLVVILAVSEGPRTGAALGFSVGLLQDLLLPGSVAGLSAFIYTLAGHGTGRLQGPVPASSRALAGIVGITTLAAELSYALLIPMLGREWIGIVHTLRIALVVSLYNVLLTPLLAPVLNGILARLQPVRNARW